VLRILITEKIKKTVRKNTAQVYRNDNLNKQDKAYEDRLRCLRLWTLEENRNRQHLSEVLKMDRGLSTVRIHELFYTGRK